jgi:hypothetical protein
MKPRFRTRTFLILVTVFGVALALLSREATHAFREQAAYQELQRRGAWGDDWPGWKELFLGRKYAPIVEISLPKNLTIQEALPFLTRLDNLKSLSIQSESIPVDELMNLESLNWIDSLYLNSVAVTDDSVAAIAGFGHLRWLSLKHTRISEAGRQRLQAALPNCSIQF